MRTSIFILAMLMGGRAWSQAPLIQTISPVNTGPQGRVLISGSGFSASPSDLIVLFGNSRGTIASSTNFSIQVDPPPQARMTNIEVINVVSGLSGKSSAKFNEAFG
ncbi:MAG TPA: IPT/TIG domain-containing protein, partial [Cyclobacteriaceae bacterium]|nr:IPT/TIG domain-containing protein [Cyclobacteriaceae bacterium]